MDTLASSAHLTSISVQLPDGRGLVVRDPAATLVYVGFPFVFFHVSSTPKEANPSAGPGLDLFEVNANQVCLRGATTFTSVAATLTAERGVLRGTAIDAKGATTVTCRKKTLNW